MISLFSKVSTPLNRLLDDLESLGKFIMLDCNLKKQCSDYLNSTRQTIGTSHHHPFEIQGTLANHHTTHSSAQSSNRSQSPLSKWWNRQSSVSQNSAIEPPQSSLWQSTVSGQDAISLGTDIPFSNKLINDPLLISDGNDNSFIIDTHILSGTLRADTFNVSTPNKQTVISGNGNVDFGAGSRDLINLSDVSLNSVTVNLANRTGGVVFNPGNGNRVFDAIDFNNGQQILFEGIDSIRFADGMINLSVAPNDPLFAQQWNLHMMGIHHAWRFTTGSTDVMVGVEDTGLTVDRNDSRHPEIGNTITLGSQVIDDEMDNHGTSVQGIIASQSNNGIGMSGINWNSSVFNIDVLDRNPGDLSVADGAQAIIDQAKSTNKRLVINMSLGVPESFGVNYNRDLEQVVQNNPDVLFVIAAGNDGHLGQTGIASPAFLARSYSNVMAVGAVWGTQDYFSRPTTPGSRIEYAGWWGSQYGRGLTVMGPSEVIAPTASIVNGTVEFNYSTRFNGTSAATPNVAGVASLVLSANSNLSATQVRDVMAQTAVDVGTRGYDAFTGHGFVNADAAVRRAIAIGRGYA